MDLNVLGELHNMCFLTRVHNHVAIFQTIRTMEKVFNQMHYLLLAFLWCSIRRGKGSTLGKCQLCCCMIWSLQGRLIITLFIILAIFPMNVQGLKQKHFVASAQGQRLCISIFALINNIISERFRKCYEEYFSTAIQLPYRIWYRNLQVFK